MNELRHVFGRTLEIRLLVINFSNIFSISSGARRTNINCPAIANALTLSAILLETPYMTERRKHQLITYFITTVWLINGLVCKVLNLVPRHQEIVARVLGDHHARMLTVLIGLSEIAIAVWILSGIWTRLNAITQIIIIAIMNTLEFILVPDLLLWGKVNAVFAFLFILIIYHNEFLLKKWVALQA